MMVMLFLTSIIYWVLSTLLDTSSYIISNPSSDAEGWCASFTDGQTEAPKKKKNMAQGYTDGKTQSQDISLTVAPPSPPPARFWCPVGTFQNGQLSGWKVFSESLLSQLGASKKYVCAKRGSVNSRPQSFVTFWGSQQRHRPMEELSRIYLSVICL